MIKLANPNLEKYSASREKMSRNQRKQENSYNKYASSFQSSGRSFDLKDKYETSKDSIKPSPAVGEESKTSEETPQQQTTPVETSEASNVVVEKKKAEEVEDVNVLGAKLIKAELFGDQELIASLKARLEIARQKADAQKQLKQGSNPSSDSRGSGAHQNKHQDNRNHGNQRSTGRDHNRGGGGGSNNQKRNIRNRQDDDDDNDDIGVSSPSAMVPDQINTLHFYPAKKDSIKKLKNQNASQNSASSKQTVDLAWCSQNT